MLVRQPKTVGPDFIFDEATPFIATGPFKLVAHKDGAPDGVETEHETPMDAQGGGTPL